jgi:hypothetical protein
MGVSPAAHAAKVICAASRSDVLGMLTLACVLRRRLDAAAVRALALVLCLMAAGSCGRSG